MSSEKPGAFDCSFRAESELPMDPVTVFMILIDVVIFVFAFRAFNRLPKAENPWEWRAIMVKGLLLTSAGFFLLALILPILKPQ
jgi:hypothetical protein